MAEQVNQEEEKMEVDEEIDDYETDEEEELPFINLESRAELERLAEGYVEDENEEPVLMSYEEIEEYLKKKIAEYSKDPDINPNVSLKKRIKELRDQIKDKKDELLKLKRAFDEIYRNQIKFFRYIGILPKVETKSIGVSVDLPVLPDTIPPPSDSKKDDLAEAKVLSPSIKRPMNPNSAVKNSTNANKPNPGPASKSSTNANKPNPDPKSDIQIECIDLTDDTPMTSSSSSSNVVLDTSVLLKHPAPVPARPYSVPNKNLPNLPQKPRLAVSSEGPCIALKWEMPPTTTVNQTFAKLSSFEIFGYQEQKNSKINSLLWQRIGAVDAMSLPMMCKLNQFLDGHTYHFIIRAIDVYKRYGNFSSPVSIVYKLNQ